jgi:membrane protease YdiL (CAAX protease family)
MAVLDVTGPPKATRFAARHPVATFLLVGLPLAYLATGVAVLAQYDVIPGRGLPARVGMTMEEAASVLLVVAIFGTALTLTAIADGRDGVRILFRRMARRRVPLRWWLTATAALPVGTVALAAALGDRVEVPDLRTVAGEIAAVLVAFLAANLWEEATWAGFVQTRLERRHRFVVAAALTAVPFALVHLPLRVVTGEATTPGELAGAFAVLLVLCLVIRVLLGTMLRVAANSVLVAAVTHTSFNRSNNADGVAADVLSGPNRQTAALLVTLALTVVLAVANRRRLTRAHRRDLDARETSTTQGNRQLGSET